MSLVAGMSRPHLLSSKEDARILLNAESTRTWRRSNAYDGTACPQAEAVATAIHSTERFLERVSYRGRTTVDQKQRFRMRKAAGTAYLAGSILITNTSAGATALGFV